MAIVWTSLLLPLVFYDPGGSASSCVTGCAQPILTWITLKDLFYTVYDGNMNMTSAWCACHRQPGDSRLAILDEDEDFNEVMNYLKTRDPRLMWLDASRLSGTGDYTWRNGCPLPLTSDTWGVTSTGEPSEGEDALLIKPAVGGFIGRSSDVANFPALCQSSTIPIQLPSQHPDYFTWVFLGEPPQLMGFSTVYRNRNEAILMCSSNGMVLASLDMLFDDVATYMRSSFSDPSFWWIGATRTHPVVGEFLWPNGNSVNQSLWMTSQPSKFDTLAQIAFNAPNVLLAGLKDASIVSQFICHKLGYVDLPGLREFGTGCSRGTTQEKTTTESMTTAETSTPDETTTESVTTTEATTLDETTTESVTSATTLTETSTATAMSTPDSNVNASTTSSVDCQSDMATCDCAVGSSWAKSLTTGQIETLLQDIQDNLTVSTYNLSSSIRKRTSASDSRTSAQVAGIIAVFFMSVVAALFLGVDMMTLIQLRQQSRMTQEGGNLVERGKGAGGKEGRVNV